MMPPSQDSTALQTPPSLIKLWIIAARPQTLPAAIVPVLVGTAVAFAHDSFALLPALAALITACLIQIGTNFANDYFDFKKGADTPDRLGPTRVTQAGLIAPEQVKRATALTFGAAALVGFSLIFVGGWPVLAIGIASILAGLAYTGGPFPLAYNGLGDIFVFIFFGVVAVCGTFYVQALTWSFDALLASIPIGLIATAILVVNNYRDFETDIIANKRTLATRIGRAATRAQYCILILGAYLIPLFQIFATNRIDFGPILALGSGYFAARCIKDIVNKTGRELNQLLAKTGQLLLMYGTLYAIGIAFTKIAAQ